MTTATTERYLKLVEKVVMDKDLKRRVGAIQPGDGDAILALAASQGYVFTIEELNEASREITMMVNTESVDGELSEGELEMVTGGLVVIAIIAIQIGLLLPAVQKVREPAK